MIASEPRAGVLLVASGASTEDLRRQSEELARALAARLGRPVTLCRHEDSEASVVAGIRTLIGAGSERLVALPVSLSTDQRQPDLARAITWASRRWPFFDFHVAAPPIWDEWAAWLETLARDALSHLGAQPEDSAILLAGEASSSPVTNANLPRLAHLVREAGAFARVEHAFLGAVRPSPSEVAGMLAHLGLRTLVVVPWLLATDAALRRLADQMEQAAADHGLRAVVAHAPLAHDALIDVLVARHRAALDDRSLLAQSWTEIQAEIARERGASAHAPAAGISAEEAARLEALDRRINEMLPPGYEGRYQDVCPVPMSAAPLTFGPDGTVAWDEMWDSFCDLALAGGPPHRETLLEAVTAAEALAEPEQYRAVVMEIERGIRLVTGLPVLRSTTPGWVAVRCDSDEMAIWLMRAIIVENVIVRREGDVLHLPAGPRFTLKGEIRNVVTVIAKVVHYWSAHVAGRHRAVIGSAAAA